MLNYETLLSSYDEKLTLMQWLKKVEEALKDASAVSFNVNKRGDATLTFSVVFEDGSELETDPIILQQGESVQSATIRNGHLILTLTNGDELDAGDLGGVSSFSIDGSQHLIVHYQNGTTQDLGAIFTGNVSITGNFAVSGNISIGAASLSYDSVEGVIKVTKPIVENMLGYSLIKNTKTNLTINVIYAGAVKNGNKLTLVLFQSLTRTGDVAGDYMNTADFVIPDAIAAKLYPYTIAGETTTLDYREVNAYKVSSAASATLKQFTQKVNAPSRVAFTLIGLSSLALNEEYVLRSEITFLLSENLAA